MAFEASYAVEDGIEETPERVAAASGRHAGLMADWRFRCQLCAPELQPLPSGPR